MKTLSYLVVGLFALVGITLLGWGIRTAMFPARVIDRSLGTVEGVIDKTLTPENAIYNYEWFKRQKEAVIAIRAKEDIAAHAVGSFEAAAGPRKDWTFEDKTEDARLRSIIQGLESQEKDIVAEYNARSAMATRSVFQDGKIPAVLEVGASLLK